MLPRRALLGLVLVLVAGGMLLCLQRDRDTRGTPTPDAAAPAEPSPVAPAPALAPASALAPAAMPAPETPAPAQGDVARVEAVLRARLRAQLTVEHGSARIAGTVLWPDATPVAGARVDASRVDEFSSLHVAS